MRCPLDDAGIFVGMASLPVQYEREFYKKEMEVMFEKYKDSLDKSFTSGKGTEAYQEFTDYFYKPKPYYMLGRFDMAIISLIDDYEFSSRTFHPFDPMADPSRGKPYFENFGHKVITGPTPKFDKDYDIVDIANKFILDSASKPLLGICVLKLNNPLLIGSGTGFLRSINKFIKAKYDGMPQEKSARMDLIILESYSWHETTLLLFSDSYKEITKFLIDIISSDLERLINELKSDDETKELLDKLFAKEQESKTSSLIKQLFIDNKIKSEDYDLRKSHLFSDSEIYFGFDFRIFEEIMGGKEELSTSVFNKIDPSDETDFISQWYIRPGHMREALESLSDNQIEERGVAIGKSELIFSISDCEKNNGKKTLSTRENIKNLVKIHKISEQNNHERSKLNNHVIQIHSIPYIPEAGLITEMENEGKKIEGVSEKHFYFLGLLRSLQFNVDEIKEAEKMMRALQIPKIISTKILNIFSNFNDGILDKNLFAYFYELKNFLVLIINTLTYYYELKNESEDINPNFLTHKLGNISDNFEKAYRNRFHNSYRMGDITDFNLEYKGGIQQLVTSFDSAYKAVCLKMGNESGFACVAGNPNVSSTEYEIRLNYFHIYQPEIFLSVVTHEAANYMLKKGLKKLPDIKKLSDQLIQYREREGELYKETVALKYEFDKKYSDFFEILLKQNFFEYSFLDLMSYYFTYHTDTKLFNYWYWGYFIQFQTSYVNVGKIDEYEFLSFMLRMFSILNNADPDYYKNTEDTLNNTPLSKQWKFWTPRVKEFFEMLNKETTFINSFFKDTLSFVQDKYQSFYENFTNKQLTDDKPKEIKIAVITESEKLKENIKNGNMCTYNEEDNIDNFQFTQILSYTFLKFLKDEFGNGNSFLTRGEDGIPQAKKDDAKILFDPMGGIFTHNPEVRRNYFKYRSALTMSLWDMGLKTKKAPMLEKLKSP